MRELLNFINNFDAAYRWQLIAGGREYHGARAVRALARTRCRPRPRAINEAFPSSEEQPPIWRNKY